MRVIIYLDEPLTSEAVKTALATAADVVVEDVLDNLRRVVSVVESAQPDILLLSFTPEIHVGLLKHLRDVAPNSRIVLWTHSISPAVAHQAMDSGIRGILPRTYSAELVVKCLHKVFDGELWFDRGLLASYLACRRVGLTRRQAQLVGCLADGLKNKEIANTLSISEGTVRVYLSKLFEKFGAKDRFEMARLGLRNVQLAAHPDEVDASAYAELEALYL